MVMIRDMGNKGRPRKYSRIPVMNRILEAMAKGDRCLEDILEQEEGLPDSVTIYEWIGEDTEEAHHIASIFSRAQELWCRAQLRKTLEIADDQTRDVVLDAKGIPRSDNTAVNRDRLRVGARQWAMAKLAPKIFGEKIEQQLTGKDGAGLTVMINVNTKQKQIEE